MAISMSITVALPMVIGSWLLIIFWLSYSVSTINSYWLLHNGNLHEHGKVTGIALFVAAAQSNRL